MFMVFLALLVAPATAVRAGETVSYEVNGDPYKGYYVSPPSDEAPLVLLVHDWNGLTDYEVKRAEMLADSGYAVFAADLFGAGVRPTKVEDKRQHTGEMYANRDELRDRLRGALKAAEEHGANVDNAVAMGYCFGGAAVLELARAGGDLEGFATFHGGLSTPEGQNYADTKAELLIMHGTADSHITMEDFTALAEQLEQHGVPHRMMTYGGAPHAFTVFGSDSYTEGADRKSWRLFQRFLVDKLR